MKSLCLGVVLFLVVVPSIGCAFKPKCDTVNRLLVGPNGRRAKFLSADAGDVAVLLYWGRTPADAKFVPLPECSSGAIRFQKTIDDVPPNTMGYELYVLDEGASYRVIVRWTNLRPASQGDGVLNEGTTDSERVKKE